MTFIHGIYLLENRDSLYERNQPATGYVLRFECERTGRVEEHENVYRPKCR